MSMTNKCKVICINKYNLQDSRYYFEKGKLHNLIVWEYENSNGTSEFQYGLHNDDILIPLIIPEEDLFTNFMEIKEYRKSQINKILNL